ncbi:MAG: PAS domain S-box protein [Halobacteriota archaeon]
MAQDRATTILLIEDSPSDTRLIEELLHQSSPDSFTVLTASTLVKGLELLSRNSVDVILLDLGLPDSQGIDTFRAINEHASHLPIIILTISDDESLGQQAVHEGAQRFVSKDVLTLGTPYAGIFTRMIRFTIEQKRTETALAESERHYRELVNSLDALVLKVDPTLHITFANDYALALLGYVAEEFVGRHVIGTLLPDTESTGRNLAQMADDVLAHPEGYEHNRNEVMTKDRRRLWIEWTNVPQYDEDGTYIGVLSTGIDITAKQQAEKALQQAHEEVQILNEELQSTNEELRTANEELEYRVQERTEQLASTNEELRISNEELRHEVEHRTEAEAAARTRARYLDILNRVIQAGNEVDTVQTASSSMISTAVELTNFDGGIIFLLNEAEGVAELQHQEGCPPDYVVARRRIPLSLETVARVYRGEPLFLEDYPIEVTRGYDSEGMNVAAGIPLVAQNKIIGHYAVISTRPHHFTDEERELLVTLGHEAGTVIARMKAQEALTNELAITETITRLTPPLLFPTLDFDGLVLAILDDAKRLTGSAHGFIALIDPLTKELVARGHTQMMLDECDIPSEKRQIRFPLGADGKYHALSTYAINERKGFFTNAPDEHPAATGAPDGHVPLERFLAVPARVGNDVVGEIALANPGRDYTERDVAVVGRLAEELLSLAVMRKRAEEQLRESSLYARSLIEASLDPLVTISAEGIITDVNEATEEVTGCSRNELISSDFSNYFTEPEKARAGYKQVFRDGFVKEYPLAIRHRSGKVTDVLYNAVVYRDEAGEVQGVFAAARDVTDRKRAEEELQRYSDHLEDLVEERAAQLAQSERQYRTLVETADSIILTFDAGGIITFINEYGAHFYGYTVNELIGQHTVVLVPEIESTGRPLAPLIDDIVADPDAFALNINENITKDGRRVWVRWTNKSLTDADGTHIGDLAIGNDITEQRRTEQALHDAQRLAGIGETAAMIGHDLRNPLQGLQYIVDLQKLRFERMPTGKRTREDWQKEQALFDRISEQIFYMDKIVGDLQDYARPIEPEHEEITFITIINDVLQSLPPTDGVETVINVSDLTFVADPHLMLRVFSNLILNALQAMPHGGTLTIGAEATDGAVAIHVTDTGVGIPVDISNKLFSPLTTGKAKGTGLGLAVVKRIVEAHNGTITFESEEGKGTTFIVTLPQAAE